MFQTLEPVTNCDQFQKFFFIQSEHKVCRESFDVPFDLLVQCFSADAIKVSQVSVDDNPFPTNELYHTLGFTLMSLLQFRIIFHVSYDLTAV